MHQMFEAWHRCWQLPCWQSPLYCCHALCVVNWRYTGPTGSILCIVIQPRMFPTCSHGGSSMAQQARRQPAYPPAGGNGIPRSISAAAARGRANGMDALLHALNERMRNGGGIRMSRAASLSSSSSGGGSLGSPGSVMSQHQVTTNNGSPFACHLMGTQQCTPSTSPFTDVSCTCCNSDIWNVCERYSYVPCRSRA